jgi:hypothetical protein
VVDGALKRQIETSLPGVDVRVILRQDVRAPEVNSNSYMRKAERYAAYVERYLVEKQRGIELALQCNLHVDDLPGTPDIVVFGTKEAMLRLFDRIADGDRISIVPDRVFLSG